MRIIYSYIPKHDISYITTLIFYLSATKAKELTGKKALLYTNIETAKYFQEYNFLLEYNTNTLVKEDAACPSIPKVKTYSIQTKPFLHIDLDTVLFQLPLTNPNTDVSFAHLDIKKNDLQTKKISSLEELNKAYIEPYSRNIFPDYYNEIKLGDIPNMNIVLSNDSSTISKAATKALELYEKNKEYFDEDYYRFCTIEQLAIHAELYNSDIKYKQACDKHEHVMHKTDGLIYYSSNGQHYFEINGLQSKRKIITNNEYQAVEKLLNENFGGYVHFGSLKHEPIIKNYIEKYLLLNYPEQNIVKVKML